MLQSTFSSKLLNLGTLSSSNAPPGTTCDQPGAAALPLLVLTLYRLLLQPLSRFLLARSPLCVGFFGSSALCWHL